LPPHNCFSVPPLRPPPSSRPTPALTQKLHARILASRSLLQDAVDDEEGLPDIFSNDEVSLSRALSVQSSVFLLSSSLPPFWCISPSAPPAGECIRAAWSREHVAPSASLIRAPFPADLIRGRRSQGPARISKVCRGQISSFMTSPVATCRHLPRTAGGAAYRSERTATVGARSRELEATVRCRYRVPISGKQRRKADIGLGCLVRLSLARARARSLSLVRCVSAASAC